MAQGVPAYVDNRRLVRADHDDVTVAYHAVHPSNFRRIAFGGDDRAAGCCLDGFVTARVIGVPMGVPDLGNLPAAFSRVAQIGIGIGCVDAHCFA